MKYAFLIVLVVLSACAPGANTLPTALDLTAVDVNTATAAYRTAVAQITQTAERDSARQTARPPTLPATWTPMPTELDGSAPLPFDTEVPRLEVNGALYFIFGGLGIARLEVGSSITELIGGVGLEPRDLTLSPDGKRLAFTGLASGNAREVYISNLDGSGLRQVSCLGFGRSMLPRWSPDSQSLLFGASQIPDGPPGLYVVKTEGTCPTENGQRQLTQLSTNDLFGLAWSNDGTYVFFGQNAISRLTLSDSFIKPMSSYSGYGPDFSPAPRPGSSQLFYLKTFFDQATNQRGGTVYQVDSLALGTPTERRGAALYASRLSWSRDGRFLLIDSVSNVWVQDQTVSSTLLVVEDSQFAPISVFSPAADYFAFVDADPTSESLPQLYVISRSGEQRTQISFHRDGSITDLNWGSE